MSQEDVIEGHPLRMLKGDEGLPNGEASLMLARSGDGKSAALINFALDEMLQGNHVFHFDVGMPSDRVHEYYKNIFGAFASHYHPDKNATYDDLYNHFTVISYQDADRMVADLDAEIDTLLANANVKPSLILVDGVDFCENTVANIDTLNAVAAKHGVKMLASLRIHRKSGGELDLDGPRSAIAGKVSHAYWLEPDPEHDRINLEFLTEEGAEMLSLYFCPHELIFRVK